MFYSLFLASMPPDTNIDLDLEPNFHSLENMRKLLTTDIFVSYCIKDLPEDETKTVGPKKIVSDLKKEGFTW